MIQGTQHGTAKKLQRRRGSDKVLALIPDLSVTTDMTPNKSLSLSGPQFLKCNRE